MKLVNNLLIFKLKLGPLGSFSSLVIKKDSSKKDILLFYTN